MRIGSLFAGIGGFDLAARWMGWETAWFSEIDGYASNVLAKHWPGVPNYGDIESIEPSDLPEVDILCAGFPCQDLSLANPSGRGLDGERSGLWKHVPRLIRGMRRRPEWFVGENVPPLLWNGFGVVAGDLRALGYRVARAVIMSASAVGAPHLRERCWIVAHSSGDGLQGRHGSGAQRRGITRVGPAALPGTPSWRTVSAPYTVRNYDGLPYGVDRIKCLGNAIVPQCAYVIFQAIQEAEERRQVA